MSTNSGNADAIRVQLNRLWPSSITPNGKTLADHYVVQAAFTALGEMEAENAKLRAALERACFIAEHLMDMTDQEAWRETGAIGPEGQYEGDFRQSLIWDEIQQLRAVRG